MYINLSLFSQDAYIHLLMEKAWTRDSAMSAHNNVIVMSRLYLPGSIDLDLAIAIAYTI